MDFKDPSQILRHFLLKSEFEKIDKHLLNLLDTQYDMTRSLKEIFNRHADSFKFYSYPFNTLEDHLLVDDGGLARIGVDEQGFEYLQKVDVLMEVLGYRPFRHVQYDGRLCVHLLEAMLEREASHMHEFIPFEDVGSTFYSLLDKMTDMPESDELLQVSEWSIDEVYKQFETLYDPNKNQKTLRLLKEKLVEIGKDKPPMNNRLWYSRAFEKHRRLYDVIKAVEEFHPNAFRSYYDNSRATPEHPAYVRMFHDSLGQYVFNKDVERALTLVFRSKQQKMPIGKIRIESEEDRRRGFVFTMTRKEYFKLLAEMEIDSTEIHIIKIDGLQKLDEVNTGKWSPYGHKCESVFQVIVWLMHELVHGLNVWQRIEKDQLSSVETAICEVFDTFFLPSDDLRSFVDVSVKYKLVDAIYARIQPMLSSTTDLRRVRTVKNRFTEQDLREEVVDNLRLDGFYPQIGELVHSVFWEVVGKQSNEELKQEDLMLTITLCVAKTLLKKLNKFSDFKNPTETIRGADNYMSFESFISSLSFKELNVKQPEDCSIEIMRFPEGRKERVLKTQNDLSTETYFTNRTATVCVMYSVWRRVFKEAFVPWGPPVEDEIDVFAKTRLFVLTGSEVSLMVDKLEQLIRRFPPQENPEETPDIHTFYNAFLVVAKTMKSLETFMDWSPFRKIIVRTFSWAKLKTNEASCVLVVELMEAVEVLLKQTNKVLDGDYLTSYNKWQEKWRTHDNWNTAPLSEVAQFLRSLPIEVNRFEFVPDVRDLTFRTQAPRSTKMNFVSVVESPIYTNIAFRKHMEAVDSFCEREVFDIDPEDNSLVTVGQGTWALSPLVTIDDAELTWRDRDENVFVAMDAHKSHERKAKFLKSRVSAGSKQCAAEFFSLNGFCEFDNLAHLTNWVVANFADVHRQNNNDLFGAVTENMKKETVHKLQRKKAKTVEGYDFLDETLRAGLASKMDDEEIGSLKQKNLDLNAEIFTMKKNLKSASQKLKKRKLEVVALKGLISQKDEEIENLETTLEKETTKKMRDLGTTCDEDEPQIKRLKRDHEAEILQLKNQIERLESSTQLPGSL